MGFFRFFAYRHPVLNFFFHDPEDKLKGFLRRAVILNVLTLTFTFTIINDQGISHGKESTKTDMTTLYNDHQVTSHLIITLVYTVLLFVVEWINEFIYGMTKWSCMETPCCAYFKYAIYSEALWLFLLNIILYAALLREETSIFLGWLFSYGLYTLVVSPLWIIISYNCLGGKQKERLREVDTDRMPLTATAGDSERTSNAVNYV